MNVPINKNALNAEDVARMLSISKNTVYELVKRGELNCYKVGRKIRFTQQDVEQYISTNHSFADGCPAYMAANAENRYSALPPPLDGAFAGRPSYRPFVIAGQDGILDALLKQILYKHGPMNFLHSYTGSCESLAALYYGQVQMAACHLWDRETNTYNLPYITRLIPGVPLTVIHAATRMQGFFVAKGNPKHIASWADLTRPDVVMMNREKGSGTRVLLDSHLLQEGISTDRIQGYQNENRSSLALVHAVSSGKADVVMGNEKLLEQASDVQFLPLQTESYDLVLHSSLLDGPQTQAILEVLRSPSFQAEFNHIGGYDTSGMGEVIARL